jgi:phospholipid/cholesterol/gamma-HCH transport system ATP-binding protein
MTPIISVRDLVVEYDGRRVLNGLNLDIEHGETMVLLGGSGCGKSTLLRQIIGLEKPKSGSVFVKEVDITRCSKPELKKIRKSIGVAFQSAALFNSLNIEENVALPLREHTRLAPSIIELVVWMKLAAVGLADRGKLLPSELSGGMKKRAAVARAIALAPEILVLDEPSAGLDPIVAAELDELILLLKHTFHMTIIVVTHELPSAFLIADRIAMLYEGSFSSVGTKDQLKASQNPRVRQFLDRVPEDIVVTHELPSAFLIADRIAMLYEGSFSSVGTKDQLKASQNPRVRQFLDRVPEDIARTPVTEHFAKYLNASEAHQ